MTFVWYVALETSGSRFLSSRSSSRLTLVSFLHLHTHRWATWFALRNKCCSYQELLLPSLTFLQAYPPHSQLTTIPSLTGNTHHTSTLIWLRFFTLLALTSAGNRIAKSNVPHVNDSHLTQNKSLLMSTGLTSSFFLCTTYVAITCSTLQVH